MPSGTTLIVVAVALFLVVTFLAVADYVVYRQVIRRLKEKHGDRWETLQWSSRWRLWRLLWHNEEYAMDSSLSSLLRVYRVVTVAYAVAAAAWIVVVILVLLPPAALR
ncbi:MAG: hypothetical protein WCE62_21035 [Polyangiales bacterium]